MSDTYGRISPAFRLKAGELDRGPRLIGDINFEFQGASQALESLLLRLTRPEGVSLEALKIELGSEAALQFLSVLDREALLQRSNGPFTQVLPEGTAGYFDAVLPIQQHHSKLNDLHVVIVGCGAVGGLLALNLVSSGIGKLTLVDFDNVEISNLNRQYQFSLNDVGRTKVQALADRLTGLKPNATICTLDNQIECPNDIHCLDGVAADVLICAADKPTIDIDLWLAAYAHSHGLVYGTGGLGLFKGYWGPILPVDSRVDYAGWINKQRPNTSDEITPGQSFGPTNTVISGALGRDLLHYLMGSSVASLEARIELEFQNWQATRRTIDQAEEAPTTVEGTCPA